MTFTDRTMLAALVALAIPVAIHLVGRRRARRIVLPTVRFAEAAHQASRAAAWLKRAMLLALRLAAVALLVLALAGPHIGGNNRAEQNSPSPPVGEGSGVRGTNVDHPHPASPPSPIKGEGVLPTPAPIRVLIVDAEETGEGVRSADLVAATFSGDTNIPKQVMRAKGNEIAGPNMTASDVILWVGKRPSWDGSRHLIDFGDYLTDGGGLVLIPGSAPRYWYVSKVSGIEDVPDGITIDPDGYTSDLLAAFEGGTSGDLSAPVFHRRLDQFHIAYSAMLDSLAQYSVITSGPRPTPKLCTIIRFHDGSPAIAEYRIGRGRVVALAFGPDPYWGDLAGRPEFVVLMHSLAEALGPKLAPKPYLAPGPKLAPGEYTGGNAAKADSHKPPPVYSRGANKAGIDLTPWLILALAVVLVAESLLAAASATRIAPPTAT